MKLKNLFETQEKDLTMPGTMVANIDLNTWRKDHVSGMWPDDFGCANRGLTSLKGAPKWVAGDFYCQENQLTSLKDGPDRVDGDFIADENPLTSLEGAPKYVGGSCRFDDCKLESLKDIHKFLPEVHGQLYLRGNDIKSHILGLLKIEGLKTVFLGYGGQNEILAIAKIINKHLENDRDLFDCQSELIDAGFKEYAQL